MRLAVLSVSANIGDAIGNLIARRVTFFLERGADVLVFVEDARRVHPAVRPWCQTVSHPEPRGEAWEFLRSADLVLVDFSQHFALLEWLPLLAEQRVRVVVDYHGVTPAKLWGAHNREAILRGELLRGLVWCAEAALVHSRFAGQELLEATGFPVERLAQLAHPVDAVHMAHRPEADLRRQLGLKGKKVLLYVGRVAPNKSLPVLVKALAQLSSREPAVHALIVGDVGDVYRAEADRVRTCAAEAGVADRLHFLGHVSDETLHAAYHAADLFVMPSLHEGFCIPIIEAMACGLPVVAARAGALPETVGNAGLTFAPDDATDLARQVARVLDSACESSIPDASRLRVAFVVEHCGGKAVGGAETSMLLMAETLWQAGQEVEIFTTERSDAVHGGMQTYCFPPDARDPGRQSAALQGIEQGDATTANEAGLEFIEQAVHSAALLEELNRRIDTFDAVLTGPYASGLALDVARAFPVKTIVVPCFHDEPVARLEAFLSVYREVGSMLYHSPEEQTLAEAELGVNCPSARCASTVIDCDSRGDRERGQRQVGTGRRCLLYCGRYTAHKELPRLFDFARRYAERYPKRFTFAFAGQGEISIPREPWAHDLGFVASADLRDVIARADALIQLSRRESLSLVALEAWAQGVPVIADRNCAVLAGHIERGRGGKSISGYDEFETALNDLWAVPQRWNELGLQGREYVRECFGSREEFLARLEAAIRETKIPLAEQMKRQGYARATEHSQEHWRDRFTHLVEDWLHTPLKPYRAAIEIQPRQSERAVSAGSESSFLPVRLVNHGTHATVPEGAARVVVRARVEGDVGRVLETPLPALILPGTSLPVAVRVPVPAEPGDYTVVLFAERAGEPGPLECPEVRVRLVVVNHEEPPVASPTASLLNFAQQALVSAERLKTLPDDYFDVTEGWLAPLKRWIKRKVLNNFKRAYVDVVVRQQSAFNQHMLTALNELAECCTAQQQALETALQQVAKFNGSQSVKEVQLPQEEVTSS